MKKIPGLGLVLLVVTACVDTPPATSTAAPDTPSVTTGQQSSARTLAPPPPPRVVRGIYRSSPAGKTFYACPDGVSYRVTGVPPGLDSLYELACGPAPYEGEAAYAVAEVQPDPGGNALSITRLDTMTSHSVFNTCLPFDFWCSGNEPFWRLLISEQEAGFGFKMIGDERGQAFPWSPAKTDGKTWTYQSANPSTGQKIKVVVRKGSCSDGMSDRRYNYSVDATVGKYMLHGCAIRFGETVVARGE